MRILLDTDVLLDVALKRDEIYEPSGNTGERLEVAGIGRYDRISVRREQNERGIDNVTLLCPCKKLACAFAKVLAEGPHIHAGEGLCQKSGSWAASPPGLPDHTAVGDGDLACNEGRLETAPHCAIVAIESD